MRDLVEFLRARLDDDEEVAHGGDVESPDMTLRLDDDLRWVSVTPVRVLVEVDAKRRIIAEHEVTDQGCETCGNYDPTGLHEHRTDGPCRTLRLLALPYATHPDYREEWLP